MNDFEQYEDYEARFDPMHSDRKARRQRKPQANHQPKKQQNAVVEEIADAGSAETSFETTYQPGRFEEGWLLESLRPFYDRGLITDVLARVKGGKEANVYRCAAHPGNRAGACRGEGLPPAHVPQPAQRQDVPRRARSPDRRREGVKKTDDRIMRAVGKKTALWCSRWRIRRG